VISLASNDDAMRFRLHLLSSPGYVAGVSPTGSMFPHALINARKGRIVFSNGSSGEALPGVNTFGMPVFSPRSFVA
jgi:hypothetical protein